METIKKWIIATVVSIIGLTLLAGFILICNTCSDSNNSFLSQANNQGTRIDSTIINTTRVISSNVRNNSRFKSDSTSTESFSVSSSGKDENNSSVLDSIVFNLTLAVNSINNILSSSAIALGILTLFLALIGLFGFNALKDSINKTIDAFEDKVKTDNTKTRIKVSKSLRGIKNYKEQTTSDVNILTNQNNELSNRIVDLNNVIDTLKHSLSEQNRFARQVNDYLYKITYDIADKYIKDDTESQQLLNKLTHDRYIANLYLFDVDIKINESFYKDKNDALEKLEEFFELDDLKHIMYVANNDTNPEIKEKAHTVISNIHAKFIQILLKRNSNVKDVVHAITFIEMIGNYEDIAHLKKLSTHRNEEIRILAEHAIQNILEQNSKTN